MSNSLIETIISSDDTIRNRSVTDLLSGKSRPELIKSAGDLEEFRKSSDNLYHRVRASLFLFVIYRFYLGNDYEAGQQGKIPIEGVKAALDRDFESSIGIYLRHAGQNSAVYSALAASYYKLSFKYLLDQVKLSISRCRENYHLYNINGVVDYPFRAVPELTVPDTATGVYPLGVDASPVRIDPSHSGWSDIFFLGMDFPEGARVVNISVNLRIHGSGGKVLPPCECYCRFIEEPVIHLRSVDLNTRKKISDLKELFNFGNDYLSLLKAGVVSSGIVPPCFEDKDIDLASILQTLLGKPGGIEIITKVNGIPKGSRFAVSTTLLAAIIARLMRFSGQIKNQTGPLTEEERRVIASRAILGEWLGGSGGGWQDSGGLWPGIKVIKGVHAEKGDPEFGISRGCLLPRHTIFSVEEIPREVESNIVNSLVLVHGGISQDVGPILEMVTEKYLLKYDKEWNARKKGTRLFDQIVDALKAGDMKELGRLTSLDWEEAIQPIIPWVNNAFTKNLLDRIRAEFKEDYWGFIMLGGMSGGGMAFVVNPEIQAVFKDRVGGIMNELKDIYGLSFPFIIDPVVYDFEFNHEGIVAELCTGNDAKIPEMTGPHITDSGTAPPDYNCEEEMKEQYGIDTKSDDHMKSLLKNGDIGLSQNRLAAASILEDVPYDALYHYENEEKDSGLFKQGMDALHKNEAAVVTFAGGMGSRWSDGGAVVKPINPFVEINGKHRSFIEVHLAKSHKTGKAAGSRVQHVFTTSYLTNGAIQRYLAYFDYFECMDRIYLSLSRSVGKRVYPMERDLRFYWEEMLHQKLDKNVQKIQDDAHSALIEWAREKGEGEDYSENSCILRFNPLGHWYEVPNLIRNGTLSKMIRANPGLKYLLCHNIDTMGVNLDPVLLGYHINSRACLTFEVTPRRIADAGGGLALIDGHVRLIEGLAIPREEDEYNLSYYNTLTNWITIDALLGYFGISREMIIEAEDNAETEKLIIDAIHTVEKRIPTYVTIKNVKYLWGSGQEDIYPVAQFEKLWGDMTGLKDLPVGYASVSRYRGQQLKEPALLDHWVNDGSLQYVIDRSGFR